MDKAWIALHVRTGTEADVLRALEAKEGAEALAPMEQILRRKDGCARRIIRPLLPGYVLVCWERSGNLWHRIRRITGVIRILGGYPPGEIPENQIAVVRALDGVLSGGFPRPGQPRGWTHQHHGRAARALWRQDRFRQRAGGASQARGGAAGRAAHRERQHRPQQTG